MKITTDPINVATQLETWLEAKKISLNYLLQIKNISNYEQLVAFCKEKNLIPCNDPFAKKVEALPLQETNILVQDQIQETNDTLDVSETLENNIPKKRRKNNNINSEE